MVCLGVSQSRPSGHRTHHWSAPEPVGPALALGSSPPPGDKETGEESCATTYGQRDLQRQARQRVLRGEPPVDVDHWRPQTRSDCVKGPRPCPFVGCRFNLFLDITPRGGLRVPHGEEPEALLRLTESCALDVAERGGLTLEAVARLQSITRERVRQIELVALERFKAAVRAMGLGPDGTPLEDGAPEPEPHDPPLHIDEDAPVGLAALQRLTPGQLSDLAERVQARRAHKQAALGDWAGGKDGG